MKLRKTKIMEEQMNQKNDTIKRRKWKHLSEKERYAIEALFKTGHKARQIAQSLNRDRRTIEREIKRGMVINNPDASVGVCCSHKVVAVGFNTLCYDASVGVLNPPHE